MWTTSVKLPTSTCRISEGFATVWQRIQPHACSRYSKHRCRQPPAVWTAQDNVVPSPQGAKHSCTYCYTDPRREPISSKLQDLHWLRVEKRITFKVLVLAYKLLHGLAPSYLTAYLQWYKPQRSLRSENELLLVVPTAKRRYGERAFPKAAPTLWNSTPKSIRAATSLHVFKNKLKTYLFDI